MEALIGKEQYQYAPAIELFYDKGKMCYRAEFNVNKGNHKLNFLNNKCILGKIGFEFISEDDKSKKQILDFYRTNNVVNINVSQKGKLIVRFVSSITIDKNEIIETISCVPNNLYDNYYSHLQQQTSTYFATV